MSRLLDKRFKEEIEMARTGPLRPAIGGGGAGTGITHVDTKTSIPADPGVIPAFYWTDDTNRGYEWNGTELFSFDTIE